MAEKLTPSQKMAVENRGGKLLVSAAAGSGKTKVLVDRLMSYLTDPVTPASLDDFLIITYTKAAAAELRGKISDKLAAYIAEHPENRHMQQQIQRLYLAKISTVHAFCADLLREYAYKLDISADFRIAEENECQEMMRSVLDKLLDEAYEAYLDNAPFRAFVDTQGLGRDDRQVPEIILQIYSSALCHLEPEKWLDWCVSVSNVNGLSEASETLWGAYLIADLHHFLDMQIDTLEKCIQMCQDVEGFEKPVSLLGVTICDLKSLRSCNTWDAIVKHPPIAYGTLTFKKDIKGTPLAEQIKAVRNNCKDSVTKKLRAFSGTSSDILEQLRHSALACEGLVTLVQAFRKEYSKLKQARRVLDFSDIEQKTLDLLLGKNRSSITGAASEIADRFREIMVDEYQDSNEVQDAIFGALTQKRNNCFMVGDVKQSIYQFRLADPGIFLEKYNSYMPAEVATAGEGRKVALSSNFRSSAGVISAVNDVFQRCMSVNVGGLSYGADEMLYEGIQHIPLPEPEVELYAVDVREDTYQEEACFVAQRIQELLRGKHMIRQGDNLRQIQLDDIVILLRSPGSVGAEFQYALEARGIPCTMGNDSNLLQTPQIDTLHAILQIIHNPLQDIPLIAVMLSPVFGFTANDLAVIRANNRYSDFYTAVKENESSSAQEFIGQLNTLREQARFLSITQLIHKVFTLTNMLSIYGAMENGEENVRCLQSFYQIAADFEATGRKELSYFLDYLDATKERGLSTSEVTPSGTVRIMSIHKSKGLEFPVVFLCCLSRGFNMMDIQKTVLCHKDLGLGLTCVNTQQRVRYPSIAKRAIAAKITTESISEELRVLYVAMTRARDRLIMTYAAAKLVDRLQEIVLRMDISHPELMTTHVSCPGSWVLQTALSRTEAGELFHIAGYPERTSVKEHPWAIHVVQAEDAATAEEVNSLSNQTIDPAIIEKIRYGLSFRYPHTVATQMPAKLTATQLKGRVKDMEAAELTSQSVRSSNLYFRKAAPKQQVIKGTEYGNALHAFLQYVDFSACHEYEGIRSEVQRLSQRNLITSEQAAIVDVESIQRFFCSDLGQKIRMHNNVLREFKFSILADASKYCENINSGDRVLLQGVVDCALIDDDGIIIIDFKTDAVTEETVADRAEYYTSQVTTYAEALSRIYQLPVKNKFLYFFRIGKLISLV